MKKLSIITAIVTLAFFGMACKKTEVTPVDAATKAASHQTQFEAAHIVSESDIDPAILQFVATHFPQTSVFNCHMTQHYYKVMLEDRTQLEFTHSYEWVKVDCEHSNIYTSVPTSIVPEQIAAYVTANFPNNLIEEIEKKNNGNWEIELNNEIEIKFDANFNVINGGGKGGGENSKDKTYNNTEINKI